ncbi:MAG: tRNA pseudouridine(38-40) synthase TruA [Acidimicrobiia bacterium]
MPTFRLDVSYDGSGFRGYASQDGLRTVQSELDGALATVLGSVVKTSVAGRTDAGVHARGQVVSLSLSEKPDPGRLQRSLNGVLGSEISIRRVTEVPSDFDARFSARWRRYRYLIDPGPSVDPLSRHLVWHVGRSLDLEAMAIVASAYVGEHDFTSFCRSAEGKSNLRRVDEATLQTKEGLIEFWIKANAFCHQMVRSLVGHMYDVGRGFSNAADVEGVIAARDRSEVATVAPPHGLTLWEVGY